MITLRPSVMIDLPPPPKPDEKKATMMALALAWELGFMIAVPAFLFAFGGAWLDKVWGTKPVVFLLGLSLAVTVSALAVWKRIQELNKAENR